MAFRSDVSVDWVQSPRIITVAAPSTEITIQDLHDTCRQLEAEQINLSNDPLISSAGKENLGGGVQVGVTATLLNALVAFEARAGADYVQCRVNGGNLVALDANGDTLDTPISPTAFTQVVTTASSSATTQSQEQLEYSTYAGGVTLDTVNGVAGTAFPIGTGETPVNNLPDAIAIGNDRGFDIIYVHGNFTFAPTDVVDDFIFEGDSATKHIVVLTDAAQITNCIFRNLTITGNLDGGCSASFCITAGLNYIDGSLLDCLFASGDIVLSGTQANFLRCASAIAGGGVGQTAYIDLNGGGTNVVVRDYQGGLSFKNSGTNNTADFSADLSSGRFVFESSIESGSYTVRGIGSIEDSTTGTAIIKNQLLDPVRYDELLGAMQTQIDDMHKIHGLDINNPVTVTPTSRVSGTIDQTITGDGVSTSTISRN